MGAMNGVRVGVTLGSIQARVAHFLVSPRAVLSQKKSDDLNASRLPCGPCLSKPWRCEGPLIVACGAFVVADPSQNDMKCRLAL